MSRLLNIGFGNCVNTGKITAVVSPEAAPVKRLVQVAKEDGRIIDATLGRRTKAVSYTHLDVYKRQVYISSVFSWGRYICTF